MQYRINLKAGQEKRQELAGTTFLLASTGSAAELNIKIEVHGFAAETVRAVRRGFKVRSRGFNSASFLSDVDCEIEVITSFSDINLNHTAMDGNTVKASIVNIPDVNVINAVSVVNTPEQPLNVVGMTLSDTPAITVQNNAAVAVSSAGAVLVAANPSRRGLRITNIGADAVAIGAPGITWAKRCLVLENGETWVEDRAANLAWSAITDAAATASVTSQEIMA